jgi:hypothetical protein
MTDVDDLLSIYATMNPDGRDRLRSFARHLQKRFPLERRPSLSLVKNANNVEALNHIIDGRVDYRSIGSAGEAVNGQ